MGKQIAKYRRPKMKTTATRPRTGSVPSILNVAAVGGEVNQIEVTFNVPVMITGTPPWTATVGGSPVSPASVVSKTSTGIVLDYGVDVSTATTLVVPDGDQSALSTSAQRVAAGSYPLS